MLCDKCNNDTPNDSLFCQHCGYKLGGATEKGDKTDSTPKSKESPDSKLHKTSNIKRYKMETAYCSNCGQIRYKRLGLCLECGKKYFVFSPLKLYTILMSIMLLISVSSYIVLNNKYYEIKADNMDYVIDLSSTQRTKENITSTTKNYLDIVNQWIVDNETNMPFFVITSLYYKEISRGIEFHRYPTCERITPNGYEVLTLEEAINKNFKACEKCFPELQKYYN